MDVDLNSWYKPNIDKKEFKKLCKKSDWQGFKHMIIYFSFLGFFGYLAFATWGTWWSLLFFIIYGNIWGCSDAIWHETGHRTAFKTRKLNDFFYTIASYMNNFEPVRWRWSHSLHHSYTASVDPHDYEVDGSIFANHTIISFLFIFVPGSSFLTLHKSLHLEILKHALGIETKVMKDCIPEDKRKDCINSSRLFVLLWISTIALSIILSSFLPILLFLLPKFFNFLNVIWGLTQHMGLKEDTKDHRLSTRSVRLSLIPSFIYWKMEYHIEHHMFPMVPSYNLPKLYEEIKDQLPKPQSLIEAYKEIIPAVIKKSKDPSYYIPVKIPNV